MLYVRFERMEKLCGNSLSQLKTPQDQQRIIQSVSWVVKHQVRLKIHKYISQRKCTEDRQHSKTITV